MLQCRHVTHNIPFGAQLPPLNPRVQHGLRPTCGRGTRHYIAPHRYHEDPSAGTVPAGYHPVNIAGIPCYSNKQPPTGTSLYSDGSFQTVQIAGSEYQAAGAAVTKGPLRILARVAGPQQSYRAEMYGAAIGAAIASDGDTQYIDNMAVTKCAHHRPTHECSDADIRHKVCDQV